MYNETIRIATPVKGIKMFFNWGNTDVCIIVEAETFNNMRGAVFSATGGTIDEIIPLLEKGIKALKKESSKCTSF